MIAPTCSLFPGEGGWEPGDPAAGRPRWYLLAVVVLAAMLLLPVALGYRSQAGRLGDQPPAPTLQAGDATTPPGVPDGSASGQPQAPRGADDPWVQVTGADPLETTVEHAGGLMLVRVTHRGDGPFALRLGRGRAPVDAGGEPGAGDGGPLVDVTGAYQGSRALALPEGTYRVGVAAGGQWGLAIEQPSYAGAARLPRTFAGVGDTATRAFEVGTERAVRMDWTVEHDAEGAAPPGTPLRVRVIDVSGDVVAELRAGDGDRLEQELAPGRYLLDVSTGAGVWRVLVS